MSGAAGSADAVATARLVFDASALRSGTAQAEQSLGTLYNVIRDNWWGIKNVGEAFAGVGAAISAGIGHAVSAAASFEQGMAGVARTTYDASQSAEANAAAVGKLGDQLRQIAQTRPVDLKTLTGIAEQAGALGVASKDVAQFTATIADLTATTNLTANDATKLARVAGVFGLTAGQYKNLGSAIFETGRSTAATETEILNMTVRFAGAAKAAGLTADQVVGLSAAVLSLGPRAEAATSALQRTFADMAKAAAGGGPELENFAKIMGVTVDEARRLIATNPGQALVDFVDGLGKSSTNAVQATGVLTKLGITEVRQVQSLQALAAGTKNSANQNVNLANALNLSNQAFVKGTAVTNAAKQQYGTLSNQLKILHNDVNDVFLSVGTLYLPVVKGAVGVTQDFATGLDRLPGPLREVAAVAGAGVGGIAALAGLFLLLGPRIILARDAYNKLIVSGRAAINTSLALQAANTGEAQSSLANALATGRNASALAAEQKQRGEALALQVAESRARAGNIAIKQAEAQLSVVIGEMLKAEIAGDERLVAAKQLEIDGRVENIAAMKAEQLQLEAQVATQTAAATETGVLTTATFALGAAMDFLLSPLGLVIALLAAAAAAVAIFGKHEKDAEDATHRYAAADQELVSALEEEASGHRDAVNALLAHQLAMNGSIEIASKYGFTVQQLAQIIKGQNAALTGEFVQKLSQAYKNGDQDAKTLAQTVQQLAAKYAASTAAAKDETAAQKALGVTEGGAAVGANDLAAAQKKVADAETAAANAAIALVSAQLGLASANLAVTDAEQAYNKALLDSRNRATELKKAELDVTQAQLEHEQAVLSLKQAEQALSEARANAKKQLLDDEASLADAQLNYLQSIDKVKAAEDALDKLRKGPTVEELTKAINKLKDAQINLTSAQTKASDAQWYLNYLQQEGASQRDIKDAQDNLAAAQQGVADATQNVADAQKDLTDLQTPATAQQMAEAEAALAAARADSAKALRDENDLEKKVAQDRKDIAADTAYKKAQADVVSAQLAVADSILKVAAAQQTLKDTKSGVLAQQELAKAALAVQQALVAQAQAQVEVQKQTALAHGHTFTAKQEALAFAAALDRVASTAKGPLAAQLHAMAAQIRASVAGADARAKITVSADTAGASKKINESVAQYDHRLDQFQTKHKGFLARIFNFSGSDILKGVLAVLAGIGAAIAVVVFAPEALAGAALAAVAFAIGALVTFLFNHLPGNFTNAFKAAWNAVVNFFASTLPSFFTGLAGDIGGFFTSTLPAAFESAGSAIVSFFTGLPGMLIDALKALPGDLETFLTTTLPSAFGKAIAGLLTLWWDLFKTMLTVDAKILGWITNFFRGLAKDAGRLFFDYLKAELKIGEWLWGFFTNTLPSLITKLPGLGLSIASTLWNGFTSAVSRLARDVGTFFYNLFSPIVGSVSSIFHDVAHLMATPFNTLIGWLDAIFDFIGSISYKISVPNWVPIIGGDSWGFSMPHWHINPIPLAKGGILTNPTLSGPGGFLAGEAGPEAVIPLDRMWDMLKPLEAMAMEMRATNNSLMKATTSGTPYRSGAVSSHVSTVNNHFDVKTTSQADAQEIADEIAWRQLVMR